MHPPPPHPEIQTLAESLELISDRGEGVRVTIHPFPADEGFKMFSRLLPFFGAAIQALAGVSLGGPALPPAAPPSDMRSDDDALPAINEEAALLRDVDIDGKKVADGIRAFALAIATEGNDAFLRALLNYTTVVRGVEGSAGLAPGKNKAHFNACYTANYGELVLTLYHVLRVNWGPMIGRIMSGEDPLGDLVAVGRSKLTRR